MPQKTSRSFVSTTSLDHTVARQFSHFSSKPVTFNPRQISTTWISDGAKRLSSKFHSFHALTKKGSLVCFRCGDSGHLVKTCHNTIVCFACNQFGHRSHNCSAITMLSSCSRPSLTPEMKAQGSALSVMRFSCTNAICEHDVFLRQGVVIKDDYHKGSDFISSSLSSLFPVKDFQWRAVPLTDDCFFLNPPDSTWRQIAITEGQVLLGDIVFPLEAFDTVKCDGGWDHFTCWVKIYGLPSSLLHDLEFDRLISEIRGFVLHVDPLTHNR